MNTVWGNHIDIKDFEDLHCSIVLLRELPGIILDSKIYQKRKVLLKFHIFLFSNQCNFKN